MSHQHVLQRASLAAVLTVFLSAACWCQVSRGTILGTVLDQSGNGLPNARVTVRETATNYERSALTSVLGDYEFIGLPVGQYDINVAAPGFAQESRSEIKLSVQDRLRIDFTLKLGQVTEKVTVEAQAPLVEGDSSARGQIIENRTIVDMPLNGRDFMALPLLAPGVTTGAPGNPQTYYFDNTIAANGMPADTNEFYVDGAVSSVQFTGLAGVKQSIDSIQEFKVMTSTYSAEFGNKSGIHLVLISKSGTNSLHGSLFEFVRNDFFDARTFFALSNPAYRRNDFGATTGGPIKKDRLFFFADYEGSRIRQGQTRVVRVPTSAELSGNFAGDPAIYNPFSAQPDPARAGEVIRAPFPDNLIPAGMINPTTSGLAKTYYPAPNNPSDPIRNYISAFSVSDDFDLYSGKVDWRVNDHNNAFLKYSISNRPRYNPGTFPTVGGDNQLFRPQLATVNDSWVISPRTLVEATLGYTRYIANFTQQNINKNIAAQAGILGTFQNPFTEGVPIFSVSGGGYAGFGDMAFRPNVETDNQYQALVKASHRTGNHSLKAGIDYRKYAWAQFTDAYFNGNFAFNGQFTTRLSTSGSNNGLSELLLGVPSSASVSGGLDRVRTSSWSLQPFLNDDWQVTRELTLTFGLRWEFNAPWKEAQDRWAGFDIAAGKAIYPQGANTYGFSIPYPNEPTTARSFYDPQYRHFAPRFGFAYRPFGSNRTAIRGGYGIYYNNVQSVDLLNVGSNFPWRIRKTTNSDPVTPQLNVQNALVSTALPPLFGMTFLYQGHRQDGIVQQWSFGVQRELSAGVVLDVSYVGSKHDHFPLYGVNFNQPLPGPGALQPRRPYPNFNTLTAYMSNSSGSYHALQAKAEKRFSHNLSFLSAFTWSKTLDNSEGYEGARTLQKWLLKALGTENHEFVFTTEFNYLLPFGKGQRVLATSNPVLNGIIGGWQAAGILALQSGSPFNVAMAGDIANCGCTNVPNRIADGNLPSGQRTINHWFDSSAFAIPAQFTFGNAGRNFLIGPGLENLDAALFKNFHFGEVSTLQVRWEVFNALNHANFGMPAAAVDVPATVGKISSAGPGRVMQFGIKLLF